jgi:Ca-activated chloride channel family protein
VVDGLSQLRLGRLERKALIVISDGGDNASRHGRQEMLDMVQESAATVYTIGIYDADDPERNVGVLKDMAKISGGMTYFPQDPAGMFPVCRKINKDIRTRYTVGYVPPEDAGAKAVRHIRVQVSAPGHAKLTAHTRSRYLYNRVDHASTK